MSAQMFYLSFTQQQNVYIFHLYSNVLQTIFLRYLVVSSSINFKFKRFLSAGAVNAVSPANPFRTEKSNIFRKYILNSALGSFSELPLIPKAQDAMTSVVYLYIVSTTSTGDPVNRTWWNSYYIFGYNVSLHYADVICFLVLSLKLGYLSLNLTEIFRKYMLSLLIIRNFKCISVFNRQIDWTW